MSVALDATTVIGTSGTGWTDSNNTGLATSLSNSQLTTVAPTLLLGFLVLNLSRTPSMTWNGVAMTLLATTNATTNDQWIWMFGLINPAVGNKVLAASWTGGAADGVLECISFKGTDTSSLANAVPAGNIVTDASNDSAGGLYPATAMSIATASGDAAYIGVGSQPNNFIGCSAGNGTFVYDISGVGAYNGADAYHLATGTTTLQFTGGPSGGANCSIGVRIRQPITGGGGGGTLPMMGVGRRSEPRIFIMPKRCLIKPRKPRLLLPQRKLKRAA